MDGISETKNENVQLVADSDCNQLKCKVCYKPFVNGKGCLKHMALQHAPPTLHCQVCCKKFDNKSSLNRHVASHLNMGKFKCDFCYTSFSTFGNLQLHKVVHSDLDKNGSKCTICNKFFRRKSILRNHMKIHTPESQERVKCKICDANVRKLYYRAHLRRHSATKRYTCSVCHKRFSYLSSLNSHYNIHTGDARHNCDICNFSSSYKYQLIIHMHKHSPEKHMFVCNKCQKSYDRPDSLKRHLKLHDNDKPFRCSRCERAFTTSYWLKIHEETHTAVDKKHHCNQCQLSYISKRRLKIHMTFHTKPFVCGICNFSFHCKNYLTRHMKVHLNGNFCQICNKTFHHLAKHMLMHKRQTVYNCQECNFVCSKLKTYKDACKHIQEKLPKCQLCRRIFLSDHGLNLHVKRYQNLDMKCCFVTKPKKIASMKTNSPSKKKLPKPRNKCQECNREFSDKYSYRQHMESHDPNKQFCCEYCHERFYSFTKLYKHLGKHNG